MNEDSAEPAASIVDVNTDSQSIVVKASAAEVYRRCLQFENLPQFITSITAIDNVNDTRFGCTSIINDETVKTVVTIMMRVPERRIAWQAVSDQFRIGVVCLNPLSETMTMVTVKIRSIIEPVMLTAGLRSYLSNFKQFVEQRAAV